MPWSDETPDPSSEDMHDRRNHPSRWQLEDEYRTPPPAPKAPERPNNPFVALSNFVEGQVSSLLEPFFEDSPQKHIDSFFSWPKHSSASHYSNDDDDGNDNGDITSPSNTDWVIPYVLFSPYSPVHLTRRNYDTSTDIPPLVEAIMAWSKTGPAEEKVVPDNMPNWHDAFDDLIRITGGKEPYAWEKLTPRERGHYRDFHQIPLIYLWSMAHRGSLGNEWKKTAPEGEDEQGFYMDQRFLPRMGQILQLHLQKQFERTFMDARQPENDLDEDEADDAVAQALNDAKRVISPILGMVKELGDIWSEAESQEDERVDSVQPREVYRSSPKTDRFGNSRFQENSGSNVSATLAAHPDDAKEMSSFLLHSPYSPLNQNSSQSYVYTRSVDDKGEVKSSEQHHGTPDFAHAFEDLLRVSSGKELSARKPVDSYSRPYSLFNWTKFVQDLVERGSVSFDNQKELPWKEDSQAQTPPPQVQPKTTPAQKPDTVNDDEDTTSETELDHYSRFLEDSHSTEPKNKQQQQVSNLQVQPSPPSTIVPSPSNPIVSTHTTTTRTLLPDSQTETRITLYRKFASGEEEKREIRRVNGRDGELVLEEEVRESNGHGSGNGKKGWGGGWFWK